jgi:putative endonuclease
MSEHNLGTFDGCTAKRRPVKLVYSEYFSEIQFAVFAERQIKGWSRKKKEALIRSDFHALHQLAECRNTTHHKSNER